VHSLHESHNLVAALCEFSSTSGITITPATRALRKDVSFGCGNVSGKVAKRELVCRRTPFDFVGRNTGDNPHGALTDFAEVIEKRLDRAVFHGNHGIAQEEGYGAVGEDVIAVGTSLFANQRGLKAMWAVLEYKQEGMDAEAVACHIKQRFPKLPIILLSAYCEMPERILWLVDEYV
jgi:CheY-like chemotaxis protein